MAISKLKRQMTYTPIIQSTTKTARNVANNTGVSSNSITIPESGIYLVEFAMSHCAASGITNTGAYWTMALRDSNDNGIEPLFYTGSQKNAAVCIPKAWDVIFTHTILYRLTAGTAYYGRFGNNTGVATDSVYDSRFKISAIKIGE